jgi:hypothetical protein
MLKVNLISEPSARKKGCEIVTQECFRSTSSNRNVTMLKMLNIMKVSIRWWNTLKFKVAGNGDVSIQRYMNKLKRAREFIQRLKEEC